MDEYYIAELEFNLRVSVSNLIHARQKLNEFMETNQYTINAKNYRLYMKLSNQVAYQCGIVSTYRDILKTFGKEFDVSEYLIKYA